MKKILPLLLILLISQSAFSQDEKSEKPSLKQENKKFDLRKLRYGGTLGASFWGGASYVDISPTVSYPVTENWEVGAGPVYQYLFIRDYFLDLNTGRFYDYNSHTYGGKILTRYFIFQGLFAQADLEILSFNYYDLNKGKRHRATDAFPLVGGGYAQMNNERSYFFILILFNLNESVISPYPPNPIIRAGLSF